MHRQKIVVVIGGGGKVGRGEIVGQAMLLEEGDVGATRGGEMLLPAWLDGRRLGELMRALPRSMAERLVGGRRSSETLPGTR